MAHGHKVYWDNYRAARRDEKMWLHVFLIPLYILIGAFFLVKMIVTGDIKGIFTVVSKIFISWLLIFVLYKTAQYGLNEGWFTSLVKPGTTIPDMSLKEYLELTVDTIQVVYSYIKDTIFPHIQKIYQSVVNG